MTYRPTAHDFNAFFRGKLYGNFDIFTPRSYADFVRRNDIDLDHAVNAFDEGGLLGTVVFAQREQRVWFALMGIRRQHRGRGFGRELFKTALETVRASGARSIEFEIVQRNAPAIGMVRTFGFTPKDELYVWARNATHATGRPGTPRRFSEAHVARIARTPATCWQREPRSVAAARDLTLVEVDGAYAFVRIRSNNGVLVDAGADDVTAAVRLARELDARIPHDLTLLNEPSSSALSQGFARCGWRIVERQHRIMGS
jgi:GNAT superfamily N-acetyltransferase